MVIQRGRRLVGLCKSCRTWRFYRPARAEKSLMLGICMEGNGASECMSHRDRCGKWKERTDRDIDLGVNSVCVLRFENLNTDTQVRVPQYEGETVEDVWEIAREYMGPDLVWGQAQRSVVVSMEQE